MSEPPVPKDRFSSLDALALARELKGLEHARVDKAFDGDPRGYVVTFRSASLGRRDLVIVPGVFAALLSSPAPHAEGLSPFAKELRRLLEGAKLTSVGDPHGERYLELELRRAATPEPLLLALELFGTGNVLVVRGSTIAAVHASRRWASRVIRPGAPYSRPPGRSDPWLASEAELETALRGSRTDRGSTLAARLGFGGPVAEELLARTLLSAEAPAPTDAGASARVLHTAIAQLISELGEQPKGYLYRAEGPAFDAEPIASVRWRSRPGVSEEPFATFSEAAWALFASEAERPALPTEASEARGLLDRQRDQQSEAVATLTREVGELREDAEAILAHYDEAERALQETASEGGAEVNAKLGERTVRLPRGTTPSATARERFEEMKRRQLKLKGAEAALIATDTKIAALPTSGGPTTRTAGTPEKSAGPLLWFEKYRWFVASEGTLVIGGRDAPSNDLIVRRYLKARDAYVHADIHGAASVIVKHAETDEAPFTESTLREAGQWAVAYSKAWRAGLASADAFWVGPDQVDKAAASGEFVARGAWVIHGTKNWLKDLPLELALGQVPVRGSLRWTVGPPSAVRARGEVLRLFTPGEERGRADRERELASELGVSRDLLQRLLPAGGLAIRRP